MFAAVARADTAPTPADEAPPAIPPDVLAAARSVVDAEGGIATAQATLTRLRNQLVALIATQSHKPVSEVGPILDELILPEVRANVGGLIEIQVGAYASHFTVSELQDVQAFYQSPTGRKLVALKPTITQETFSAVVQWSKRVVGEAIKKHADELKQRGLKI